MLKNVRKSAVVLVVIVFLLVVSVRINSWIGYPKFSDEQIQAVQFALTLAGIFLGAYYELQRLERLLKEERRKELRQQRLNIIDHVETWLKDVNSNLESIATLRTLSPKDESDGALIVSSEKIKPIQESLLKLDKRGQLAVAKAVDIGDKDLAGKVGVVWLLLDTIMDSMSKNILPGVDPVISSVVEAQRAVDKARMES